ncbi:MAG: hypothetical protein LIP02_12950 [Bacteroidales bacterium]|nr:hypothetical protein [Bacteroidales bacterium]
MDPRRANTHGRGTAIAAVAILAMSMLGAPQSNKPDNDPIRPTIPTANRYQQGRVFLERADELRAVENSGYQLVVGNVEFRKGDMFMYCDSAHFYDATESLEAFGNVRMEQGDTLFVYADMLNYDGQLELAELFADPGKKVRLINRDVMLQTDVFNYDLGINLGYYKVGGVLTDKQNRLESIEGEYSPASKDANFYGHVHLNSRNEKDTLDIYTDTLLYNTDTHIAELVCPSEIVNAEGTIFTSNGTYNTLTDVADLYDRSLVVTRTDRTLTGDTLFYDRKKGYGEAFGNMIMVDSVKKMTLMGDYGYYNELTDSAFVTGRALAKEYSKKDTLYIHADTLRAFRKIQPKVVEAPKASKTDILIETIDTLALDSASVATESISIAIDSLAPAPIDSLAAIESIQASDIPQIPEIPEIPEVPASLATPLDSLPALPVDSISLPTIEAVDSMAPTLQLPEKEHKIGEPEIMANDTINLLIANPRVRFYRVDLQGLCDSLTAVGNDSLLYMDIHPIVWSGDRQIFGNRIIVHFNDSTADWAHLPEFGFMTEMIEDPFYNQLSGKEMKAYFEDQNIKHLDVSGNVQAIFLPQENDSTYNKIVNVESSFLAADFVDRKIDRMKIWPETSGTTTPLYLAKRSLYYLPQFKWHEALRPKDPMDVFNYPEGMAELMATPDPLTRRRKSN